VRGIYRINCVRAIVYVVGFVVVVNMSVIEYVIRCVIECAILCLCG